MSADDVLRLLASVDMAKLEVHAKFLQQLGHELDPAIVTAVTIAKQLPGQSSIVQASPSSAPNSEAVADADGTVDPLLGLYAPDDDLDDGEEAAVDGRIEPALMEMNSAGDHLNKVQATFQETQRKFEAERDRANKELAKQMAAVGDKLILKTKPYFETRRLLVQAKKDCDTARMSFDAARQLVDAAKQAAMLVEKKVESGMGPGGACTNLMELMEELNDANERLDQCKRTLEAARQETTRLQPIIVAKEKELKEMLSSIGPKTIKSAEPYFEALAKYTVAMERSINAQQRLGTQVESNRSWYKSAMTNLDVLSNEIHETREAKKTERQGSELEGSLCFEKGDSSASSPLSSITSSLRTP